MQLCDLTHAMLGDGRWEHRCRRCGNPQITSRPTLQRNCLAAMPAPTAQSTIERMQDSLGAFQQRTQGTTENLRRCQSCAHLQKGCGCTDCGPCGQAWQKWRNRIIEGCGSHRLRKQESESTRQNPTIEQFPRGLLYTNHNVPDGVLRAMLDSVFAAGLTPERLTIVGHRVDSRFPASASFITCDTRHHTAASPGNGWVPAILEQMEAGLLHIPPESLVCCLEHDVLYPTNYFATVQQQATDAALTYFWVFLKHLNLDPAADPPHFWHCTPTVTYASGMSARADTMLANVRKKLAHWNNVDRNGFGDYEPHGDRWAKLETDLATGEPLPPLIDIRTGANATNAGHRKPITARFESLPGWGSADELRAKLQQPDAGRIEWVIWNIGHRPQWGGVCALNQLGNELTKRGEHVTLYGDSNTEGYGGRLVRPGEPLDVAASPNAVVIYPEIVRGNPLGIANVVRWILATPKPAAAATYGADDLPALWNRSYAYSWKSEPLPDTLFTTNFRADVFRDRGEPRSGVCYCIRKGRGKKLDQHPVEAFLLDDFSNHPDAYLADQFNRHERFISYDHSTLLSLFAVMCGCESVVIPADGFARAQFQAYHQWSKAIAYGFDDIERAKSEASNLTALIEANICESDASIERFIWACYDRFVFAWSKERERTVANV